MVKQMDKIELPDEFEPLRGRFEATVKPYVKIETEIKQGATLWQSKFLGLPYFPKSMTFPEGSKGNPLYLLAQINFAEMPPIEGFPKQGILQFYLPADDSYGIYEFPFGGLTSSSANQSGLSVIYHSDPVMDKSALVDDFAFMPSPWTDESTFPVVIYNKYLDKPDSYFSLTFSRKNSPISPQDYRFESLIGRDPIEEWSGSYDEYNEQFEGHRLGGYASFTQSDPRMNGPDDDDAYILLLQIDSDLNGKIDIMWGDMGICNFFIRPSALKRLDFEKVVYNWDCS